jgi:hypothetical protein
MSETRDFELGDVLSVTSGRLVARRHIGALYDLLGFMTGDTLFTHQLPGASDACAPELLRQHPWLAGIEVPDWSHLDRSDIEVVKAAIFGWVDEMELIHGGVHKVQAGAPLWRSMDPVAELDQMAGNRPVMVVHAPLADPRSQQ